LTLIHLASGQQKRVLVYLYYYLEMSYSDFSVADDNIARDKSLSLSNSNISLGPSSSDASSSTLPSNFQIPSIIPNAHTKSQHSQQPSSSKILNPTALPPAASAPSPSSQPSVLSTLREKVEKLPRTVPVANKTHILAAYSQSPQNLTSDIQNDEDVWETWDQKLNVFLQCNDDDLKQLVVHGKFGLIGLAGFFEHLVRDRKVGEGLLEGKAKRLVDAIDVYVSFFYQAVP
jgi:hypothetical protein